MEYGKNTIYVTGASKISSSDPISALYDVFFVGVILDKETGRIVDSTCNMVREETNNFIKSILTGYNLIDDIEVMVDEIKERFHGMAQKAVVAAVKDARNKYMLIRNG